MHDNYSSFLEYRAVQRRLAARFAHPRGLMLHTLAFLTTMTAIWIYGMMWRLWIGPLNYPLPMFIGTIWSLGLALHAGIHYWRSSARAERRELAVEAAMREYMQAVENGGDPVDQNTLFTMHQELESQLERQGRWSVALFAFALVNVLSWAISTWNMGSSWAFQMTLPLAGLTVVGIPLFMNWHSRQHEPAGWFARLPLRHLIAYTAGCIGLWFLGAYRLINPWDAENLTTCWTILLLIHIVWAVVVGPLIRHFLPGQGQSEQPAKRKPASQLVLADDGEVLDIAEQDSEPYQAHLS